MGLFTAECKTTPYWWDQTPRPAASEAELPASVDVAVIGAGYTGLSAALVTARAGRETLVLDAADAGWGCSTRNGGHVSTSIKPEFESLAVKYGGKTATDIYKIGFDALAWIEDFTERERIDCSFEVCGKFIGAHNPRQYQRLARRVDNSVKGFETGAYIVPRAEQHSEIGSDFYHGGIVYPKYASIDPARFHQGLLERVQDAEAGVIDHCAVIEIERSGRGFKLVTTRGSVSARDVIVATNGYTGSITPWMRRRVIPIGSYLIATEPLAPDLMGRLIPRNRMLGDTRRMVFYYRASPDRSRVLFGGRVSLAETDPLVTAPKLFANLVRIFPQLAQTKISHTWAGTVAYTFDALPHLGQHDGVYYAMGYCGSGVSLSGYLGMCIGQRLLGLEQARTGLDDLGFQTRPLFGGKPWFLAASILYYRARDRLNV